MKEAKVSLSAEHLRLMEKSEDEMYTALEKAFQDEIDKGLIASNHARLHAVSFIALLTAGKAFTSEQSLDDLVNEILDLFWYGISPKE